MFKMRRFKSLWHMDFGFGSCLGFRYSDFVFQLGRQEASRTSGWTAGYAIDSDAREVSKIRIPKVEILNKFKCPQLQAQNTLVIWISSFVLVPLSRVRRCSGIQRAEFRVSYL
jgi:hypothetical protein